MVLLGDLEGNWWRFVVAGAAAERLSSGSRFAYGNGSRG